LPSSISVSQKFFKTYKKCTKNREYEEATKIKAELIHLIEKHIDTTAEDMRLFGEKLGDDKLFLESILSFDVASTLSEKVKNHEEKLEMIQFCVQGLMKTNKVMIEEDPDMMAIVKEYVIPLMHDKLHLMESTSSVSEQFMCLQVSCVCLYIGASHYLVGQLKEQGQLLREAIKRMDNVFGESKIKQHVYGTLLNNLGAVCLMASCYEEAASFFKQAIDASKTATDYDIEEERKEHIKLSEKGLRIVQQKSNDL